MRWAPSSPLAASVLGIAMVLLTMSSLNVALPSVQQDLGGDAGDLAWVANTYLLVFGAFLLATGALTDRLGAAALFASGVTAFGIGSLIAVLAPTLTVLVLGEVVLGIGAALLMPGSLALISEHTSDDRERGRAIATWAAGQAAAYAAGPIVGGVLTDVLGWRGAFAQNLPLVLAAALLAPAVRPPPPGAWRTHTLGAQVVAVVTVLALTFALIEGNKRGWTSQGILSAIILGGLGAAALARREQSTERPLIPHRLLADRAFSASTCVGVLLSFAVFGQFFVLSFYLQGERGLSPLEAGLLFLPQSVAYLIVSLTMRQVSTGWDVRRLMILGPAVGASGLLLLVAGVDGGGSNVMFVVGMTVLGVGGGMTVTSLTAAVMGAARPGESGVAAAAMNAARQLGAVTGVAVLGAVALPGAGAGGTTPATIIAAAALLLASGVGLAVPRLPVNALDSPELSA